MFNEPEWIKWHCVEVDISEWMECKDWAYKHLGKLHPLGKWNWSRFVPKEQGLKQDVTVGFYFRKSEDALVFKLANNITEIG